MSRIVITDEVPPEVEAIFQMQLDQYIDDWKDGVRSLITAGAANEFSEEGWADEINEIMGHVLATSSPQRMDVSQAETALREFLDKSGYIPAPGTEGTIQDLRSPVRLRLIITMQRKLTWGHEQWYQGMHRAVLFMSPAWEFVRVEQRIEPRNWPERWTELGGMFYPGKGPYPEGRMIALKTDSIWTLLSRFQLPYAPFDYNSGMGLRGVDRNWCIQNGLIRANQKQTAPDDTFKNELVEKLRNARKEAYDVLD